MQGNDELQEHPDRDTMKSPAEVLFSKMLRDHMPNPVSRYKPREEWRLLAADREKALSKRATVMTKSLEEKFKKLDKLTVEQEVRLQNQVGEASLRWGNTGVIVEARDFDQYLVKTDGSGRLILRNRQYMKPIFPYGKFL